MPKTREQIKHDSVSTEVWRNNKTQVGGLWFDPRLIRPLGDHILLELDGDPELPCYCVGSLLGKCPRRTNCPSCWGVVKPDSAAKEIGTRIGTVLAVGPGKWHEKPGLTWELTKQIFRPTTLKPGDRVAIGHYSDWESWNSDFEGRGPNIVLCQENDVRVIIHGNS